MSVRWLGLALGTISSSTDHIRTKVRIEMKSNVCDFAMPYHSLYMYSNRFFILNAYKNSLLRCSNDHHHHHHHRHHRVCKTNANPIKCNFMKPMLLGKKSFYTARYGHYHIVCTIVGCEYVCVCVCTTIVVSFRHSVRVKLICKRWSECLMNDLQFNFNLC